MVDKSFLEVMTEITSNKEALVGLAMASGFVLGLSGVGLAIDNVVSYFEKKKSLESLGRKNQNEAEEDANRELVNLYGEGWWKANFERLGTRLAYEKFLGENHR